MSALMNTMNIFRTSTIDLSLEEQNLLIAARHPKQANHGASAPRAVGGKTMSEMRALFAEKSRTFALEHNKVQEPLPAEVGEMTLKQWALHKRETALLAGVPIAASMPEAPTQVFSATVAPEAQSGPESMRIIL